MNHKVIIVVNKIDRPDARPLDVALETIELLEELNAGEDQLDSPILYCSARKGIASTEPEIPGTDLSPLFDAIIEHIPAPMADPDQPLQLLVSSVDYNNFVGRIGIGRVDRGVIKPGQQVMITNYHDPDSSYQGKINTLFAIEGLNRVPVEKRGVLVISYASVVLSRSISVILFALQIISSRFLLSKLVSQR